MAMTMKEFYEAVANEEITEEVKALAQKHLDKYAEEDASKTEKKEKILNALTSEPQTAAEIAEIVGVSRQSVSSNLTYMIKQGHPITKTEVERSGKLYKAYSISEEK